MGQNDNRTRCMGSRSPHTADAARAPERQTLRQWLTQPHRTSLRIGGCGHLLLDAAERRHARVRLVDEVLPQIAALQPARVSLFVGLAPGADMLLLKTATDWFSARGLPLELTALLPVPVPQLVRDWVLRAQDGGQTINAAARARMQADAQALLARCDVIVTLYPDDLSDEKLASRAFRQRQYQHLAALVAQHADLVVAILREGSQSEPGGTAEILRWREQPDTIPPELRLRAEHCAQQPVAMIIDPRAPARHGSLRPADPLHSALQQAELARRSGNGLLCLDLIKRALDRGLRSPRLDYLRIQSLANTGDVASALDAYRSLDLDESELDEDWLALHGRLEKDLGLRGGTTASRHFARAATAYLSAYEKHGGYYSGVNAASMLRLGGEVRASRRLARRVLKQLEIEAGKDAPDRYFRLVSAAEAALLLGDTDGCRDALRRANRLLPDGVLERSRTRQQLRHLCTALGMDDACLAPLRLPPVVLLHGHGTGWTPGLDRLLKQQALLHLALHTPEQLDFAERLLARGARLYLALPQTRAELLRSWRMPALRRRLDALIDAAEACSEQRGFLARERDWAATQTDAMLRGLSQLTAARLGLRWQVHETAKPSLLAAAAPERQMVGLLFADFASFRRLDEASLPRYYRELMTPIAALIDRFGDRVRVRKTWGDALHLVTADAATAAALAIDIQRFIARRRLRRQDRLGDLELRIAAHYAPAYRGFDPIEQRDTGYGTQLMFAARIEPVAPPGMIYVTEAFAAQLTLEAQQGFALDYAGEVELAKRAGTYRLFALRRDS